MSDFTLQQLKDTLEEVIHAQNVLTESVKTIAVSLAEIETTQREKEQQEDTWDNFLIKEMSDLLVEFYPETANDVSQDVVKALQLCRTHGDYRSLIPTYHQYNASENLKVRQMLKLVSAADRMKFFGKFAHRSYHKAYLSTLKSEIKYAKACPECGMIAGKIWDRMEKENMI